jgi:predicted kinase
MKQKSDFFCLSYDALKWSFSNYKSETHYQDVQRVLLAVADTVFDMKYNIITDSVLYASSREELVELANSAGYEILEINLETDFDVLSQRFDERVASALANPNSRISNISKDRFKELFDIFQKEKNQEAMTIRTDTQSIEEVASIVMKLLA